MVEVIYNGNLGNNLFQYCFGRILAERLGLCLKANPIKGFERTGDVVTGKNYEGNTKLVLRGQKPDMSFLLERDPRYHIVLTGYFQRYEYYKGYRPQILKWLNTKYVVTDHVTPNDVVMGIRRGADYIPRHGLTLSYYEDALKHVEYDRLFICTNDASDPFIGYFQKHHRAIVRRPDALDNMVFIAKFNKLIISNSTFLWWAAYLSNAAQIVCPRPYAGFWSKNDPISKNIDLEIIDQRYTYIETGPYRAEFICERMQQAKDHAVAWAKHILKAAFPFMTKATPKHEITFEED